MVTAAAGEAITDPIRVEVAYALPEKQKIIALTVARGCYAMDAVVQSNIVQQFPEIQVETAKMGVFGKAIKPKAYLLQEGDRVEIYRPLLIDPKESRKERASRASGVKTDAKTEPKKSAQ